MALDFQGAHAIKEHIQSAEGQREIFEGVKRQFQVDFPGISCGITADNQGVLKLKIEVKTEAEKAELVSHQFSFGLS